MSCYLSTDVPFPVSIPVMKTAGRVLLKDMNETRDGDINTCVTVQANEPSIVRVPIEDPGDLTVTVKTVTGYESLCSVDKTTDHDVYAMTDYNVPSESFTGPFQKCALLQEYEESALDTQFFNCTCVYDVCYQIYVRIHSLCPIRLCSIEVL